MKKKRNVEADLDPAGTRHTRPGGKAAERALANSRTAPKQRNAPSAPTRPGSTAAGRAVAATKRKPRGGA